MTHLAGLQRESPRRKEEPSHPTRIAACGLLLPGLITLEAPGDTEGFTRPAPVLSPSSSPSSLLGRSQGLRFCSRPSIFPQGSSAGLGWAERVSGAVCMSPGPRQGAKTRRKAAVLDAEGPSHPGKQPTPRQPLTELSPCWAWGHGAGAQASTTRC